MTSAHQSAGTILVVDDEPMVVEVVARYLKREGFEVLTAASGEQALSTACLAVKEPDAVIPDVMLPGISARMLWQIPMTYAVAVPRGHVVGEEMIANIAVPWLIAVRIVPTTSAVPAERQRSGLYRRAHHRQRRSFPRR